MRSPNLVARDLDLHELRNHTPQRFIDVLESASLVACRGRGHVLDQVGAIRIARSRLIGWTTLLTDHLGYDMTVLERSKEPGKLAEILVLPALLEPGLGLFVRVLGRHI